MVGGALAKDLTGAFGRMGHAGVAGILNAPPFPAMASTYGNAPLTEAEIHQLAAFMEQAHLESGKAPVQLAAVAVRRVRRGRPAGDPGLDRPALAQPPQRLSEARHPGQANPVHLTTHPLTTRS
jgi:hypothetical protein